MDLEITSFGTIKGLGWKETSIPVFLKFINKNINKRFVNIMDNLDYQMLYSVEVTKDGDGIYSIYNRTSDHKWGSYTLNARDYPELKKRLDGYAEVTKKHEYERKCYEKICFNEPVGITESNYALEYLKKGRNHVLSMLLGTIFFGVFGIPQLFASVGYIASESGTSIGSLIVFIPSLIFFMISLGIFIDSDLTEFRKRVKFIKVLDRKIKQIKRKIGRKKTTVDNVNVQDYSSTFEYHDKIVNDMNRIKVIAEQQVNKEDRLRVLSKLSGILDEYLALSKRHNNDRKGLFLSDERQEIIKRLAELEFELNDILSNQSRNQDRISENEKFRQELSESISSLSETNAAVLTRKRTKR